MLRTKRLSEFIVEQKNTKKMRNEETTFKEDHFDRLPEEIVLSIFNRVTDLKSLCMCSLVSKYFASVIPNVQTITITLPCTETPSAESWKSLLELLPEISYIKSEHLYPLSIQKMMKLPALLKKFRKVESIYLEYFGNASLIMWKAKTGSSNVILDKFVAILPASVHKKTGYDDVLDQEQDYNWENPPCVDCFKLSFGRYVEWLCLICMITISHSSLQSVTITDSEKQGKLVIKDEQLVNLRTRLHEGKQGGVNLGSTFIGTQIPVLHLPLSGYIMKQVSVIMVKHVGEDSYEHDDTMDEIIDANDDIMDEDNGEDDNMMKLDIEKDIMGWDFEKHENVLGEAVKEILKNHRDKMRMGTLIVRK